MVCGSERPSESPLPKSLRPRARIRSGLEVPPLQRQSETPHAAASLEQYCFQQLVVPPQLCPCTQVLSAWKSCWALDVALDRQLCAQVASPLQLLMQLLTSAHVAGPVVLVPFTHAESWVAHLLSRHAASSQLFCWKQLETAE
jgi:hypothetical protein